MNKMTNKLEQILRESNDSQIFHEVKNNKKQILFEICLW